MSAAGASGKTGHGPLPDGGGQKQRPVTLSPRDRACPHLRALALGRASERGWLTSEGLSD